MKSYSLRSSRGLSDGVWAVMVAIMTRCSWRGGEEKGRGQMMSVISFGASFSQQLKDKGKTSDFIVCESYAIGMFTEMHNIYHHVFAAPVVTKKITHKHYKLTKPTNFSGSTLLSYRTGYIVLANIKSHNPALWYWRIIQKKKKKKQCIIVWAGSISRAEPQDCHHL